jgi:hypothetical protein
VAGPETISKVAIFASTPVVGFLIWAMDGRGRAAAMWTIPLAIWNAFAVYATTSAAVYLLMMGLSLALTAFLIFHSDFTIRRKRTVELDPC